MYFEGKLHRRISRTLLKIIHKKININVYEIKGSK